MYLLIMTLITIGWSMGDRGDLSNLMPERSMAIRAFDLMVGDMFLMHELGGILRAQDNRLMMAFSTFSFRDMTIPLHNTYMAFLTSHPSGDIFPMIKIPTFDFNIPFGFDMTRSTTSNGT